jgi:hypothetical protein
LPALDPKARFATKHLTKAGTMAQDDVHGNLEAIRFQPPPEFQGKWEAYVNKLAKVPAPPRAASTGPQPANK